MPDHNDFDASLSYMSESSIDVGASLEFLKAGEKKVSRIWRAFVCIIVLGLALAMGFFVYTIAVEKQTEVFETEFYEFSQEMAHNTMSDLKKASIGLQHLANTISSVAANTGQTWPEVTISHFSTLTAGSGIPGLVIFLPLVSKANLAKWEKYAASNSWWEGVIITANTGVEAVHPYDSSFDTNSSIADFILWQYGPEFKGVDLVMMDMMSHEEFAKAAELSMMTRNPVMSDPFDGKLLMTYQGDSGLNLTGTHSLLICPILESKERDANVVGVVASLLAWDRLVSDSLPHAVSGLVVNVDSESGRGFEFVVNGTFVTFVQHRNITAHRMGGLLPTALFSSRDVSYQVVEEAVEGPAYTLTLRPSSEFNEPNNLNKPLVYTVASVIVFVAVAFALLSCDCRHRKASHRAENVSKRSGAISASLFTDDVREQLMEVAEAWESATSSAGQNDSSLSALRIEMTDDAQLFPEVTVMLCDIVGFLSWASSREPIDVFALLQAVYGEFDRLSKRYKILRIETTGDNYLAVCGVPKANSEHHIAMARFANDCLKRFWVLLEDLESELGEGTTELGMRIGLHSGSVTAGVLQAHFQLFGDTVDTTSLIESNGMADRIHVSDVTAKLLERSGFGHWVTPREDSGHLAGKENMQTFWLEMQKNERARKDVPPVEIDLSSSIDPDTIIAELPDSASFEKCLLEDAIGMMLNGLVNHRQAMAVEPSPETELDRVEKESLRLNPLDTAHGIVVLPDYVGGRKIAKARKSETILPTACLSQLKEFIASVETLYPRHRYHNFDYAKHVTKSVLIILERLNGDNQFSRPSHSRTAGISFDPLSQLAIVLAAMCHGVAHPGVSNAQLVKEGRLTGKHARSVAEQNSAMIAWKLFLHSSFKELRKLVYTNVDEFERFRRIMIRTILCTDVLDINLNRLRSKRWEEVFGHAMKATLDAKATVAIEHAIQVAHLSHTMSSWQIYRYWNMQQFLETYEAHKQGRGPNPADIWYTGQISFFDNFIVPLATKIRDCEVFGNDRGEFLVQAEKNRSKWFEDGKDTVLVLERYALANRRR